MQYGFTRVLKWKCSYWVVGPPSSLTEKTMDIKVFCRWFKCNTKQPTLNYTLVLLYGQVPSTLWSSSFYSSETLRSKFWEANPEKQILLITQLLFSFSIWSWWLHLLFLLSRLFILLCVFVIFRLYSSSSLSKKINK